MTKKEVEKWNKLNQILPLYTKKIDDNNIYFDFINTPWTEWETLYYTLKPVEGFSWSMDGISIALSNFSLRALAQGYAKKIDNEWKLDVQKVGVFAHDNFNFARSENGLHDFLGCWNCKDLKFDAIILNQPETDPLDFQWICLNNAMFNNFRERFKVGSDFLVLSLPRIVDHLNKSR